MNNRIFQLSDFEQDISYGKLKGTQLKKIYERKSDKQKFLIKSAGINPIINEYIMGGVYKHFLGDHCPETILILEDNSELKVGSKWYEGLKTFKEIYKQQEQKLDYNHGIEEIMITSLICGESDFNYNNIAISDMLGVVRFDFSFSKSFLDNRLLHDVLDIGNIINLNDHSKVYFKGLIDIFTNLSEIELKEIKDIISQRVSDLETAGCNFNILSTSNTVCSNYKWDVVLKLKKDGIIKRIDDIQLKAEDVVQAYKEFIFNNITKLKEVENEIMCGLDEVIETLQNNSEQLEEQVKVVVTGDYCTINDIA